MDKEAYEQYLKTIPKAPTYDEFVSWCLYMQKHPRTLDQKIDWVKNHPGTTAQACDVSAEEVLRHPEKYAEMMAY